MTVPEFLLNAKPKLILMEKCMNEGVHTFIFFTYIDKDMHAHIYIYLRIYSILFCYLYSSACLYLNFAST